ncbi:hypothetical protein PVK06_001893 [Gossypium arboreum]|uniref:Uncharacterized protein n=1 Tax=Gossypium arboreum TaxID=29729 RepID=A0ABR0R271_GOSAR|nr:hypothetical protein PVK06_001893 [Gossypium arboreum]
MVLNQDMTKDMCNSMKQKYQGSARVNHAYLQALHKEFEAPHMKEGEYVNEYFSQTLTIANKMKENGRQN